MILKVPDVKALYILNLNLKTIICRLFREDL